MATRRPTTAEIDAAKEYLERRLREIGIVADAMHEYFVQAAIEIADIARKYLKGASVTSRKVRALGNSRCASEIQEVIDRLIELMRELCEDHIPEELNDDEDKKEAVFGFLFDEEFHGNTFDERIEADRTMLLMALNSFDFSTIEDMDMMDASNAIIEASSKPLNRLETLAKNTVALAFAEAAFINASNGGKSGFWVINGSDPCKFCAMMEGFHPMTDEHPPYHVNCRCITVYV